MEKNIIVIDIDGTLSVVGDRRKYIDRSPQDWERFYADDFNDLPIPMVCDFVRRLAEHYEVVFCTSRRESVRDKTQLWLQRNLSMTPRDYTLIMRANPDTRPDVVSKIDAFIQETTDIERANVAFVIEDSPTMAMAWRKHGYRCFQVS